MKKKMEWEVLKESEIFDSKCPICEGHMLRKIAGHKNKNGTFGFAGIKPPKWWSDDYFDCWVCDNCKVIVRKKGNCD